MPSRNNAPASSAPPVPFWQLYKNPVRPQQVFDEDGAETEAVCDGLCSPVAGPRQVKVDDPLPLTGVDAAAIPLDIRDLECPHLLRRKAASADQVADVYHNLFFSRCTNRLRAEVQRRGVFREKD
jgi:hypothetical protein